MRGVSWDAGEHVGQPGLRIDAIHLGRDNESVRNLVCEAIVTPMEGDYGYQQEHA